MRCHYEVLESERDASADEIKLKYRKLALKWHPGTSYSNVLEIGSKEVKTRSLESRKGRIAAQRGYMQMQTERGYRKRGVVSNEDGRFGFEETDGGLDILLLFYSARAGTEPERLSFGTWSLTLSCLLADKNSHDLDAATERFKEITNAYTTLSDANERAWYDSHREQILRGGDGTSCDKEDEDCKIMRRCFICLNRAL